MKIKIAHIIGQIFFLFNTMGLPSPFVYTNFLSLFYVDKLVRLRPFILFLGFAALSFTYLFIHFHYGVQQGYYIKSFLYNQFLFINTLVAYYYIKNNKDAWRKVFELVAKTSFVLFLISVILFFTPYKELMWKVHDFNVDVSGIPRYKGLLYEPSYYAFVMAPVFVYFFFRFIFWRGKNSLQNLIYVAIPFLLTLSLGVFMAFFIAVVLAIVLVVGYYLKVRTIFFVALIGLIVGGVVVFQTDNVISQRITSILKGEDTSVKGRTVEAFYLSYQMAKRKNVLFGIGPGQIKVVGEKVIRPFYKYPKSTWPIVQIPNSSAETLAIYGIVGFILRILTQIFLFFYFKVYRNYFNLTLFCFVFVYQFSGSFITSTAECVIWLLALIPIFTEFKIKKTIFKFKHND